MNKIQKKIQQIVPKIFGRVAIVKVPETRNSSGMADTINRVAGRKVCHFSLLLGCIVADDPDTIKKSIWDQWFESSTKIVYLGA